MILNGTRSKVVETAREIPQSSKTRMRLSPKIANWGISLWL